MTTTERPAPERTKLVRRRFLVWLALALVLGAALWWWTHPRSFSGWGGELGAVTDAGEPVYVGLANAPRELEILEVRPLVVSDDADATVIAVMCVGEDDTSGIGAGDSDMLAEHCHSVREPAGPMSPHDQILVEVRGSSAGVVVVDGVAVTYRDGMRRGTEVLDFDIRVEVWPPGSMP